MVIVLIVLFSLLINYVGSISNPSRTGAIIFDALRISPNGNLAVNEIQEARQFGYPIKRETIKTTDGYLLTLFRMQSSPYAKCKMPLPVYIHHGLMESSDFWLFNGPRRAMAYVLADSGYDVWLGNARGNTYSREHEQLSINSSQFWQFSFHEIALYDNPAVIDHILSVTNRTQLHYIGHSQGTTTFFITMSLLPEYNKKIRTMHALAPVVFFKDTISPVFRFAADHSDMLTRLANEYGFYEFIPSLWLFRLLANIACESPENRICFGIFRIIGGQSPRQKGIFPRIFSIFPSASSMFQFIHYAQIIQSGNFSMYDYGKKKNLERYGVPSPPHYPLENVVANPIFLYFSAGDFIAQLGDIKKLMANLPNKAKLIEIEDQQFGHFDYAFGKFAKKMIYNRIIKEMKIADNGGCEPEPNMKR